ncbi:MAG: phosphoribosylglycinamide formyltransferase [Flavobacteriales bacterium]|nr:phosphoribosylglycinamide formyltransferase [Flavobacteriales bacterium]
MLKKLAIFASGGGSNAQKIHQHFSDSLDVTISHVIVNNPNAEIIKKAKNWNCKIILISRKDFYNEENLSADLKSEGVDLIVLAGFLWLIPQHLLKAFPEKIVNIHPALLPKYGGKGMHGMNVHRAVFEAEEKESGITIHTIDEEYDKGEILFQKAINVEHCASAEEIASAVLSLEHQNFASVLAKHLKK